VRYHTFTEVETDMEVGVQNDDGIEVQQRPGRSRRG
jgi:hypothetical protein